MSTILVPIDFSEETPEVIECAAMLARRNRSQLVLMHVTPTPGRRARVTLATEDGIETVDKLERLERYLRDEGYEVSSAVRRGDPGPTIVSYGGSIGADCIIIGRHDHAVPTRRAKSSVTSYVEKRAGCAVVAVP